MSLVCLIVFFAVTWAIDTQWHRSKLIYVVFQLPIILDGKIRMPFKHTISSTGFSNLFGYGMPDLIKALELDVGPLEINKLRTSQFNNNVALNALNALEAWQAGYTGSGVKVGVFDAFSRSKSSGCRSDLNHYAVSGFLMEFPPVGFVKSIFPLFVEWM